MNLGNAQENRLFVINSDKKYFATANDINPKVENNSLSYIIKAISENSTVLDVGCSYGYLGEWLIKNKDCQVYGIDIDKKAVAYTKERGYYKDVFNLDLDYPQNTKDEFDRFTKLEEIFDFVICADVLEHLKDPTNALDFISLKLKFGGQVLVSMPNVAHMDIILNLLEGKFNYSEFGILDNTHLRFFTKKSFVEWIKNANEFYKDKGFKFDIKHVGATVYVSEYLKEIKNNYAEIYNKILNVNNELEILQHIFVLTKVNSLANTYGLEELLSNTNYPDAFQIIFEENNMLKQEIEKINFEMINLKEKFDAEIANKYLIINNSIKKIEEYKIEIQNLNEILSNYSENIQQLEKTLKEKKVELDFITKNIEGKEIEIQNLKSDLNNKEMYINDMVNKYNEANSKLVNIYDSHGWKALLRYYKIRNAILPEGSKRKKFLQILFRKLPYLSKKSISYIKIYRFKAFLNKSKEKILSKIKVDYKIWIEAFEPKAKDLEAQRKIIFSSSPQISIIVPTYNTEKTFLIDMIKSVLGQTYSNWQLCIADGASKSKHIEKVLDSYAKKDKRIKVKYLSENKGIAGNSNEAISLATGDYIALLDHDDTLAPFALFEVVKAINKNPDADFIYSDEDKLSEDGKKRTNPHFKPEFAPDTLRSYNYICHLSVIKKELLNKVGYFREGFEESQDYDLILRCTEKAKKIIHIPKILYHWRMSENSVAQDPNAKPYAYESGKKALKEHLERIGLKATPRDGMFLGSYKIDYDILNNYKVSIIIPNKDHKEDLETCINSIIEKTAYKNYEIIIVENNSKEKSIFDYYKSLQTYDFIKIITWNKPFNYSAVNNYAVKHSNARILLFLNNDTEVITPNWLEEMISFTQRKDVGIVGAKLLYKDNTIQHGGVIIGIGGVAGHAFKYFNIDDDGYFGRLKIVQNLSAITGACLMIRKEVFEEVGGFDEGYPVAFNDIDLCMKVRDKNYLVVWTPYAMLYHHESKSRGYDDSPEKIERFNKETELFKKKWDYSLKNCDPYYNPNLTLEKEDFSYARLPHDFN